MHKAQALLFLNLKQTDFQKKIRKNIFLERRTLLSNQNRIEKSMSKKTVGLFHNH